jgi:hypothetical protein
LFNERWLEHVGLRLEDLEGWKWTNEQTFTQLETKCSPVVRVQIDLSGVWLANVKSRAYPFRFAIFVRSDLWNGEDAAERWWRDRPRARRVLRQRDAFAGDGSTPVLKTRTNPVSTGPMTEWRDLLLVRQLLTSGADRFSRDA